jgi:hypothetical protein
MSKDTKAKDWDNLWGEYMELLRKWTQGFQALQKVSAEVQAKYNEVATKAMNESSEKTLKEFYENWQKTMNEAGLNTFKQFGQNWQKITNQPGIDQMKTYGELMNAFAETWQKMWKK